MASEVISGATTASRKTPQGSERDAVPGGDRPIAVWVVQPGAAAVPGGFALHLHWLQEAQHRVGVWCLTNAPGWWAAGKDWFGPAHHYLGPLQGLLGGGGIKSTLHCIPDTCRPFPVHGDALRPTWSPHHLSEPDGPSSRGEWGPRVAYLDDVVLFRDTWGSRICIIWNRVLDQIQQAGLTLNPGKCQWAKEEAKKSGIPARTRQRSDHRRTRSRASVRYNYSWTRSRPSAAGQPPMHKEENNVHGILDPQGPLLFFFQ